MRASKSLARNHFDDVELAATIVMSRNGMTPDALAPGEYNQIKQALLRAGIDLSQALRDRYDGDFTYEPGDKFLKMQPSLPASVIPTHVRLALGDQPAAPTVPAGPLLSECGKSLREKQIATGAWDGQTAARAGATFRLFAEICGAAKKWLSSLREHALLVLKY